MQMLTIKNIYAILFLVVLQQLTMKGRDMFFIKVTFRFLNLSEQCRQSIVEDVMRAIHFSRPSRGQHLILTDDLETAIVQARKCRTNKIKVIMIDQLAESPNVHR